MSIKNQHADQLKDFPDVATRGNFISKEIEVLMTLPSFGPWYAYKVRRNPQTSIIRIFPFSIQSDEVTSVFHKDFLEEMERIAKISKEPFGYIVPISNWGITSQGSYPYMENYEVTDQKLEGLTSQPGMIRPYTEVIKIAEHLSRTLAICHNVGIIHGAISPNCIKIKTAEGQYFLDDFGASILTNEQRSILDNHVSNSLAGTVISDGTISFQTDVFALGKVLYYFVTGVHYINHALNKQEFLHVMNGLRNNLESGTTSLNSSVEEIPSWLGQMIYTCLHSETAESFSNGIELYDHVLFNQLRSSHKKVPEPLIALPGNITNIKKVDNPTPVANKKIHITKQKSRIQKVGGNVKLPVVILLVSFVVFASLFLFAPDLFKSGKKTRQVSSLNQKRSAPVVIIETKETKDTASVVTIPKNETTSQPVSPLENNYDTDVDTEKLISKQPNKTVSTNAIPAKNKTGVKREGYSLDLNTGLGSYQVVSKAYFHTKPDESTRRNAHIVHWNNAILKPIETTNDFVYIVFTNHWGQTSKGWLRKKDLRRIKVD